MRGPHDIGGLPAGPVDTSPHDMTFWEKQIDAMNQLWRRRVTVAPTRTAAMSRCWAMTSTTR